MEHTTVIKRFFWVTFISLTISALWMQEDIFYPINELNEYYATRTKKPSNIHNNNASAFFTEDIKYILLWIPDKFGPFAYKHKGFDLFVNSNCSHKNCFITSDRDYFGGDLSGFHALAFSGINLKRMTKDNWPNKRWDYQKYIFYSTESSDRFPVCHYKFDDFFNWTVSYRLDSDIPNPYLLIKDSNGVVVGPQKEINWVTDTVPIDAPIVNKIKNRRKAAAWFVSNCRVKSHRMSMYHGLQKALGAYRLKVDVYGKCGKLKCHRRDHQKCAEMVGRDYFFYLSWENSLDTDYVTEKLLTAVQQHVVPIVLGGANYSRFLPPGSYLNVFEHSIDTLAKNMHFLIQHPDEYQKYLQWTSRYTYHNPEHFENVCAVCEALNNDKYNQLSMYKDFRTWWNPRYKVHCPYLSRNS